MNKPLMQTGIALLTLFPLFAGAVEKNGFDLGNATVPPENIVSGGPPRDGIPALTEPEMTAGDKADYLRDSDLVLGVEMEGQARAYPTRILVWHEIVNDTIAGKPVAVTFCPLCGTGIAFERRLGDKTLEFGVSGLLYNSDMLMYDRNTESLWSQIPGKAISGSMAGKQLEKIPVQHTEWGDWLAQHPETRVMTLDTGHQRDYDNYPYRGYEQSLQLMFPVEHRDKRYHPKDLVIGLAEGNKARVWPFHELMKTDGRISDQFDGKPVTVVFNKDSQSARILNEDGELLPATTAFWFAWMTFYPHSGVYQVPDKQ